MKDVKHRLTEGVAGGHVVTGNNVGAAGPHRWFRFLGPSKLARVDRAVCIEFARQLQVQQNARDDAVADARAGIAIAYWDLGIAAVDGHNEIRRPYRRRSLYGPWMR